jgi:hypothetical protein
MEGYLNVAIKKKNLRNLLQIFYAPERLRLRLLRDDVLAEIKKERGESEGGPSFYGPFWADAKEHAAGLKDLSAETEHRIADNLRRKKTYPILRDGFLKWWNENRRWRNEPFEIIPETTPAQAAIHEIGCIVKIENMFSVKIDDENKRLIYPYFSDIPAISVDAARAGISIIADAMLQYKSDDIRILDVRRGIAYGAIDAPLRGDERQQFVSDYTLALADWEKIKREL